jgi:hypothetical protein
MCARPFNTLKPFEGEKMMKLNSKIAAAAIGAAALFFAAPAFAAFDYSVNYSDSVNNATYPATATISTTNALTFFTVAPGGSATGSNTPTTVGLFSLTPVSTAPSGSGQFTVTSTNFTTVFSLQTDTTLNGTGPVGAPATFTVTGTIAGNLSSDEDNTIISGLAGIPTSVVAGGVTYDIALNSIRNPGVVSSGGNTGGVSLDITAVPEPASFSLLSVGIGSLLMRRRRAAIQK